MTLLTILLFLLSLECAHSTYPIRPSPPPLMANGLCRDFLTVFIQFESRCTLSSRFSGAAALPATAHLRVFDIDCHLLGENVAVPTSEAQFNFDSQLPFVIVMERFWNATPPGFGYAGTHWGSDVRECWVDKGGDYVCAQVFQC